MKFRNDINSLRAIAVIIVVLFHFDVAGFSGGFIGVDVFFVISGYLMTKIIFTGMKAQTFSINAFYLDRARRIVPALSVLCIAVLGIGYFLLSPNDYELLGKHAYSSASFISNFVYARDAGYFATASESKWLLHTWSLSVEWQFYILFPLLLITLKRFLSFAQVSFVLIILTVGSYLLSISLSMTNESAAFFLLPTRSWEMLVGGLLFIYPLNASLKTKAVLELSGISLILFSVFYFTEHDLWPGYLALVPVLGAALVILSANEKSLIGSSKLLGWFGKTSYSLYLWHWPIVVGINYFGLKQNIYAITSGIVCSILLGYLSFRFIESKTRKVKYIPNNKASDQSTIRKRDYPITLTYFIICVVLAVTVKVSDGLPARVSEKVLVADAERKNKNPRSKACNVSHRTGIESPQCLFGDDKHPIKAVVLGDSHANTLINTIADSLIENNGGVVFMGANACHAPLNIKHTNFSRCNLYNQWVLDQLKTNKKYDGVPVIIINRAMSFSADNARMSIDDHQQGTVAFQQAYTIQYQREICRLSKNHNVYITLPIPVMPVDVPSYLGRKLMLANNVTDVSLPLARYYANNKAVINLQRKVSKTCGITLLDPTPFLCANGACMGSSEGRPLYHDDNHLSEYGNNYLVPMFSPIWRHGK